MRGSVTTGIGASSPVQRRRCSNARPVGLWVLVPPDARWWPFRLAGQATIPSALSLMWRCGPEPKSQESAGCSQVVGDRRGACHCGHRQHPAGRRRRQVRPGWWSPLPPQKASFECLPRTGASSPGEMLVENIGTRPAEVAFTTNTSQGLVVASSRPKMTLQPGEAATVQLSATVGDQTAPGDYSVIAQYSQTVAPWAGRHYRLRTRRQHHNQFRHQGRHIHGHHQGGQRKRWIARCRRRVRAGFRVHNRQDMPVATQKGTQITARVAPGRYRATLN